MHTKVSENKTSQKHKNVYNCEWLRILLICFLPISRKVSISELKVVLSAYINMHIPVILSYIWAFYDLQKPRYGNAPNRVKTANGRGRFGVFASFHNYVLSPNLLIYMCSNIIRWENSVPSKCIQEFWALKVAENTQISTKLRVAAYMRILFLPISRKVWVLELTVILSANINMHIPVILSYISAFYDLQKPRYDHAPNRV